MIGAGDAAARLAWVHTRGWVALAVALSACERRPPPSPPVALPATVVLAPQAALPDPVPTTAGTRGRAAPHGRDPVAPLLDPVAGLPPPIGRDLAFRRGVSLGLFVSAEDPEVRRGYYRRFLDEIAELGATDVQLVVRWSQADVAATRIAPRAGVTADDTLLRWVMAQARARGLRPFLMPILHLARRQRGAWRGTLAPSDVDAWWASYRAFILHYADLARGGKGDLFSVGSELASMERYTGRWRDLIAEVRSRFPGQLTYSANWDHFEPVGFWDALDVAGITGYSTLSDRPFPDEDALVGGFGGLRQRLARWYGEHGKPFLFSEIGYPSQVYAAHNPWDYRPRGGVPQLQLQLRCYRALYRVWQDVRPLAGLFVWNWFGVGGADDAGYSPRGKPSAAVLKYWYEGAAPKDATGASPTGNRRGSERSVVTPGGSGRRVSKESDG